ncbi:MAG: segregation/condensation protein A [Clostridiales bacterium]|jgi:segregation and condensation protein A|nr:segregation/condensation protein A [Clostridiales bacterium]
METEEEEITTAFAPDAVPDAAPTDEQPDAAPDAAPDAEPTDEQKAEAAARRRDEIQKYIESLENSEAFDRESYEVKLEYFEGPLDLLLFLVKRSKISIREIFVSAITEQYLSMMDQIENLDLDKASDFIEIAACLLEIKAKSLLPKPQEELPEEEDPEKLLIRRLEEYKLFKEATVKLKEYETVGLHFRDPDDSVGKPRFVLSDMNKDGLMEALRRMFLKLEQRAELNRQRSIVRDRFTVDEKINQIMEIFEERERISFFELFDSDYNKSEIISTFQAMLELLKNQFFTADQQEIFGDIILQKAHKEGTAV